MNNQGLILSTIDGDHARVCDIINYNEHLKATDEEDWTALMCAIVNENKDITRVLITEGANLNEADSRGSAAFNVRSASRLFRHYYCIA